MAADEHQDDHEPDLGQLDLLRPLVHHARRRVLRDLLLLDSCGDNFISIHLNLVLCISHLNGFQFEVG